MRHPTEIGRGGSWRRGLLPGLVVLSLAGCASLPETSRGTHAVAAQRALEYLPDAESLDWIDPETGLEARVTVLSTSRDGRGRDCRQLGYQPQPDADPMSRSYCRDPGTGLWELANTPLN